MIALNQWRLELLKWTDQHEFSVYTYHGPKRQISQAELAKYDVVLTTYSTLEYEYRAAKDKVRAACGVWSMACGVCSTKSRAAATLQAPGKH